MYNTQKNICNKIDWDGYLQIKFDYLLTAGYSEEDIINKYTSDLKKHQEATPSWIGHRDENSHHDFVKALSKFINNFLNNENTQED